MYSITYAPEAKEGLAKLKANEPQSFNKAVKNNRHSPFILMSGDFSYTLDP